MNKREIIKEIRDVVSGNSKYQYIAISKREKGYEIVEKGLSNLGPPLLSNRSRLLLENFNEDDMLFRHTRNFCTLREAEKLLEAKIKEVIK